METGSIDSKYLLQSVNTALSVIEVLSKHSSMTLADVAKAASITKSTAFRILATLEYRGFVIKDNGAQYRLGLRIAKIGARVLEDMDIVKVVHPHLESLCEAVGETAHLVVLTNDRACFIDKVSSTQSSFRMESIIGLQKSAYSTGTGKVLLAFSDEAYQEAYLQKVQFKAYTDHTITDAQTLRTELANIRSRGYGFDEGESERGLYCVAAPIFDYTGKAVASVSVSGPQERIKDNRAAILQCLLQETNRITKVLDGERRPFDQTTV